MITIPDKYLTRDRNFAVVIRHAERYNIETMEKAFEALLTDKGKKDSYEYGIEFKSYLDKGFFKKIKLYHSPVTRCIETAENIARGLKKIKCNAEIAGELFELGGPYVTGNWLDIVLEIEKCGVDEFIRLWFDGNFSEDLIMPVDKAAHAILDSVRNKLTSSGCLTLNITHDWNLMILLEHYFNIRHEKNGTPGFLDGIAFYLEEGRTFLLYRDYEVKVDFPGN